jgi:hypothetical protein
MSWCWVGLQAFGEHHPVDSGIFDFDWLPGELACRA